MEKVLVSACLLGERVRYDGRGYPAAEWPGRWSREGRVVPLCPEVAGGLSVPRPPAELQQGDGAAALLRAHGVMVFDESQLAEAAAQLVLFDAADDCARLRRR